MSELQEELMAVLRERFEGEKADEESRLRVETACREWVRRKRTAGAWPFSQEPTVRLMPELNSLAVVWPFECKSVAMTAGVTHDPPL